MTNQPKHLTEEELTAQKAACQAFDLTPYVDRLAEVLSASPSVNEIGGIAIDMAKAWMAVPCPHDERFYHEIKRITDLIVLLEIMTKERIGAEELAEIQRQVIPRHDPDDSILPAETLCSVMCDFAWAWLPSYRPCYRESARISSPEGLSTMDAMQVPDQLRALGLRLAEIMNRCPYDPARIDGQKFADLLFFDSLRSACDDCKQIARCAGIQLGKAIFNAYPEGRNDEDYRFLVTCACEDVRDSFMRGFANSKLMRQGNITPMALCEMLQMWANTAVTALCIREGKK